MDTLTLTGSLAYKSETGEKADFSIDIGAIVGAFGITNHREVKRSLKSSDGVVSIDVSGLSSVNGILFYITSGTGTIILKHNSNSEGIDIHELMLLRGSIADITIETTSPELRIGYLVWD